MCALSQAETKKLDLMFEGDSARDASSGIRGFLFQDYVTILCLLADGVDYVCSEYLEDVDVFYSNGTFKFIQVKYYPESKPKMHEISTDLYYQYLRLRMLDSSLTAVPSLFIHRKGTCRALNLEKMKTDVQQIMGSGASIPKTVTFADPADEAIWLQDHVHIRTDKKEQKKALFLYKAAEDSLQNFINLVKITHMDDILTYQNQVMESLSKNYQNRNFNRAHWRTILLGLATTYVQRRYMPGASCNTFDGVRITRGEFDDYIKQTASTEPEVSIPLYLCGKVTETYGLITNHNTLSELQAKMLDRIQWHTGNWIRKIAGTEEGQYQLLNTLSKDEADTIADFKDDTPDGKLRSIAECKDAFREFLKYLWKIMLNLCQDQIKTMEEMKDHPRLFDPATYHNTSVTDYICLDFKAEQGINRTIILPPTNDLPGDKRRVVERMFAMNEKPEKWFFRNTDLKPGENFYDYSTANIIRKHSVTDLGRKSFYIECMECIKTREGDWDKVEKCSDCIFSKKCVKEGTSL